MTQHSGEGQSTLLHLLLADKSTKQGEPWLLLSKRDSRLFFEYYELHNLFFMLLILLVVFSSHSDLIWEIMLPLYTL